MKNSKFYTEERASVVENMEAIVDLAKTEERELTDAEQTEFDSLTEKVDSLEGMAKRAIKFETLAANKAKEVEPVTAPKEITDYSFQEAYRQAFNGKLEGLVAEMDQEARRENPGQLFRGVAIPRSILECRTATASGVNGTEVMSFSDQLIAASVLASAGANVYTGIASMKFPIVQNIASSWAVESGGSDVAAAGDIASITLDPKKLISVVDMSAEALAQNNGLEAAIRRNLAISVASTLEAALLANADVTNAPASIYAAAASGGATLDAAAVLAAETTVLGNDVNQGMAKLAYLVNGDALGVIKGLAQVASVSPLYDNVDKTTNSYDTYVSSNVGNGASFDNVLFGDFSKVHIAQFGGLDLLFDPYTKSRQGIGSLIATSLVDGDAVQNASAFVRIETAA